MKIPTLHLNGTSRDSLLDPLGEVIGNITTAINSMSLIAPNARDYYVQLPGAFEAARSEHCDRVRRLIEVRDEIEQIWLEIEGQP